MATPKYTTFIIALIMVSFFAAISAPFIGSLANNYGSSFDENDIDKFNKFTAITNNVSAIQNSAIKYKTSSTLPDIVGAIFTQGYSSLQVMFGSVSIFTEMVFSAFGSDNKYYIPAMDVLKTAIITIVIILLVIGVIVKAVIKSDV